MPTMDPHARIGFSAHGSLKRSDFGMAFGVPAPGKPDLSDERTPVRATTHHTIFRLS
jgi:polyisoprenoid-binding protein YceI